MKLPNHTALATLAALSFAHVARAQTSPSFANNMNAGSLQALSIKTNFDTVNQYGDDLVKGAATAVEQQACQKSLTNLSTFVITHAKQDPFAPTAGGDAVLDDAIVKNLLQVDPTPCPTISAFQMNGKSAFTPIDPLMARTLDPYLQEEVAMHSVMTAVVTYKGLWAAGLATEQKTQLCVADFNTMTSFIANVGQEEASGHALRSDIALYTELRPLMPRFGTKPCPVVK